MKLPSFLLNRKFYRISVGVWVFFIFLVSSIPYLPNPKIQAKDLFELRLDYVFHFGVYFILGFLVIPARITPQLKFSPTQLFLILILGSAFGSIDEIHQIIIPGRRYNPVDLFYNVIGFITGVFFTYFYFVRFLMLKKNRFSEFRENLRRKAGGRIISKK
jgi:VanZ family protein